METKRRTYTDDDKGRVFLALTVNEGNVKRTARELSMPPSTVKKWKVEWERHGVPEAIQEVAAQEAEQFITDASRARGKALMQWEAKVDQGEVAARDLMTGVGVLTDKITALTGLAKSGETKPAIEPAHMRELARGLFQGAWDAAQEREQVIQEADYEVIDQPQLGTSESTPNKEA
jgi:transposase-like protein